MKTENHKWLLVLVTVLAVVAAGEASLLYRAHQERMYWQWSGPWLDLCNNGPFAGLMQLEDRMDRLCGAPSGGVFPMNRVFEPCLDLKDTGDVYTITTELPGFDKSDLNLTVDGKMLRVTGNQTGTHHFSWFGHPKRNEYGAFKAALELPERVDPSRMDAIYKHGVLKITIPKEESGNTGRKVPIQ